MKKVFFAWFGLFLLMTTACIAESDKISSGTAQEQLSLADLVKQAEAKFTEYLQASNGDRTAATEKTAAYVKSLSGVKKVTVRGSDSLYLIMNDGNELLLMLGKNRL